MPVSAIGKDYSVRTITVNTGKTFAYKAKDLQDKFLLSNNNISFGGKISPEQKKKCHYAIHGASALCGGLSGAMGEGAAVGADTPFLWGSQFAMFCALKNILGITHADHMFYIARQLMMGQVLGVKGAKYLINWLGIAAEASTGAASGGASVPAISTAVRAVNASLSAGITEKMGWGYVSQYEKNAMTWGKQALKTAIYMVGAEFFGKNADGVLDTANPSDVTAAALDSIPQDSVYTCGKVMKHLSQLHIGRFGYMFTAGIAEKLFIRKRKPTKDEIKNIFAYALLGTAIYDLIDYQYGQEINDETLKTIEKLRTEMANNPDIHKEFTEAQKELINKLNLDNLSAPEFLAKFKERKFVYNLSLLASESTALIAEKWRKRNFAKLRSENAKAGLDISRENEKANSINGKLSDKDQKELQASLTDIVNKTKNELNIKTRTNFALNRMAGYEGTKTLLGLSYITPVKEKSKDVPRVILFYGPSGLGKTAMGPALAEDVGAKFFSKDIGFSSDEKILEWINKRLQDPVTPGRPKIIQLNEFEDNFSNNPKLLEKFLDIVNTACKKNNCTLFLTTNNPMNINPKILEKADLKIPIDIANKNDIANIISLYLNDKKINGMQMEDIVEEFAKVLPDNAYSNAQIEAVISSIPRECSREQFFAIMNKTKPCILKSNIENFQKEKQQLNGEN